MRKDLSEFIPWILAIFFVLFLIACCSWLYRCIQKCDDQCPGMLPARSPYNPNMPMTPFQNIRQTRSCEGTRRLTTRRPTTDDINEPSGSCTLSPSSIVHYHGQKAPPYISFADRPPPPSYEEACSSAAAVSHNIQQSASETNNDTPNTNNTENTDIATVSVQITPNGDTAMESNPNTTESDVHNDVVDSVNESVAIDNPQDEPLINGDDEEEELNDVVIETTTVNPTIDGGGDTAARRSSSDVFL